MLTTSVPDMPRKTSAEVVNGTFILVKWQSPLNTNGILLGFQVIYHGEKVHSPLKSICYHDCCQQASEVREGPFMVNVSATASMIILDKLTGGLTYTFSVCVLHIHSTLNQHAFFIDRSEDGLLLGLDKNQLL